MSHIDPSFRVQCPVCKKKRPLVKHEIARYLQDKTFHTHQFCSPRCEFRSSDEEKQIVEDSRPKDPSVI